MFPYRDNLVAGPWPLGIASLVAFLCLLNFPLFLVTEWHAAVVASGGFIPLLFSVKPFLSSYRLITASALHGDFFHLAGNCLFLVVFGRTLERLFGLRLLLALFPVLGIAGFLAEWAMHADSPVPVIGASGAIAALMGAYLPLFPGARIRMIAFLGFFWKRFTVPAWVFLPYWVGLQLLSIALGSQDGIAYAVHAGSFAAGAIGAIIWKTSYLGAEEKLAAFKRESMPAHFSGTRGPHGHATTQREDKNMSDVPMTPEGDRESIKRWNYIGAGLIALAFGGPSLATLAGLGNAFSVGEDIARTLGALALLAFISWLIVRKKNELGKAKARTVVGILLCITVGNNIANAAKEEALAKQFVKDAFAFRAQHTAKFEDLGRRFDQVTVSQYVTPEGLTSVANVAAGVAALERYRSLLQERNLLVQTYLAEYVAFVGTLPPGQARAGAESALGPNKEATEKLYGMLDKVQGEHAAALGAVFAWAQVNAGKVSMRSGQMMFTNVAQQQELQALASRLQEGEKSVNDAAQKAQAAQVAAGEKNQRLQKEASEFLAK